MASTSLSFSTSSNQGALLYLHDPASSRLVKTNSTFPKYMYKHYDRWHTLATSKGLIDSTEDLYLVRGYMKTTQWAVFAFTQGSKTQEFTIQARASNFATAEFNLSESLKLNSFCDHRIGPASSLKSSDPVCHLMLSLCEILILLDVLSLAI